MMNLNERLATAMGYEVVDISVSGAARIRNHEKRYGGRYFLIDYQDPAISMKCLEWLLKHNKDTYVMAGKALTDYATGEFDFLPAAIALAYCEAKEG
jgi:hypothetical protein